ncbi:hypothetical protein C3L33_18720, partial [Rhododendron williamsianum]
MENREAQKQRRRTKNERKQQRRREEYSLAAAASDSGDGLLQSKARSESKLTDIQLKSVTQGFLGIPPSSSSPISQSSSLLKKNGSLAVCLVHRSSPESPFYDSNATREDLIREGLNISLARSRYYGQGVIYQTNILYAITLISHDFVMKYTIRMPPFETVGILDTRSIPTWMQYLPCLQCRRDQINDPMFDPGSSTTFMNVPCDAILCTEISSTYFIGGTCNYHVEYLNGKTSDGVIAMDVLGVEALVSGAASFPNPAIFDCGFNNCDLAEGLVSGYPTLLVPNEFGSYYLILEGISVDGEMLNIPSEDYNLKNDETEEIMCYWDEEEPTNVDGFKLCFEDMTPALEIVFNFKDYNLSLSTDNAWVKACEPHYCLAMSRSHSNLYVLGMHQQRNLEVGYYLDLQVVSFSSPSAV